MTGVQTCALPISLPETDPGFVRVANNYVRFGSTYTLTFVKPISDILSLNIATPQYVVEQIADNIESNLEESYLKLTPGDRLSMLTGDIELTTYDFRYNADFDIAWEWKPTLSSTIPAEFNGDQNAYETAAKRAIQPPSTNQGTAETPTASVALRPLVDDISGTLIATVTCREDKTATAQYEFQGITVRGRGLPASVVATGQKVGEESGAASTTFNPAKALPAQLNMDVFQGGILGYKKPATGPCVYTLSLKMGQKNARSEYAVATLTGDTGAVALYTESNQNVLQQYTPGSQIENPNANPTYTEEGEKTLEIRAVQEGTATLTIDYYVFINGKPVVDSSHSMEIVVTDTSPSTDATLASLTLRDAQRKEPAIGFGFSPDQISYTSPVIELPYVYEQYDLTPVINEAVAREKPVQVAAFDSNGNPADIFAGATDTTAASTAKVMSGKSLRLKIPEANVGNVYTVTLTVEAANPGVTNTYTLAVTRLRPSEDDMLRSLGVYAQADTEGKTNYITDFKPETRDYVITVPYSTKYLRLAAVPNFSRAEVAYQPELESMTLFGTKEYLKVESLTERDTFLGVELPYFQIDVTPEINLPMDPAAEDRATGHYRIFVNRLPPSENSLMTGMTIVDAADAAANPAALPYVPAFNANNPGPYRLTDTNAVPYSTSAVRFKITPQDELVSAIRVYRVENGEAGAKRTLVTTITNPAVFSEPVALTARSVDFVYNEFVVQIVSEAGDGLTSEDLDQAGHKEYYTEYREIGRAHV